MFECQWDLTPNTLSIKACVSHSISGSLFMFSSQVVFSLHLRRRPLYHVTYLILPFMLLNAIVSVSFFLPAEAGERVSLGLTSFLAYSMFIMLMANKIPESTTTMPRICMYLCMEMSITLLIG